MDPKYKASKLLSLPRPPFDATWGGQGGFSGTHVPVAGAEGNPRDTCVKEKREALKQTPASLPAACSNHGFVALESSSKTPELFLAERVAQRWRKRLSNEHSRNSRRSERAGKDASTAPALGTQGRKRGQPMGRGKQVRVCRRPWSLLPPPARRSRARRRAQQRQRSAQPRE